ncbi:MAG: NADH:ubiquinone oxidoreductase [Bacteroidales bacterium]|nr:NADH:ubiquinone oxidoreductase [Bacteroidales bacterium]
MALKEINIFRRHGKQFVPDPRKALLPDIFRGRPVIQPDITPEEISNVIAICPVSAIGVESREGNPSIQGCFIDLGRCVFCRECAFAVPEKIRFTHDHKIATNDRTGLMVHQGVDKPISVNANLIRKEIRSLFRHALKLRQISAGGDNSGEMELNAAGNVNFDMGRYGIEFVASPRHADGIVITGPISQNMAEAVQVCFDATPQPRLIILAGSDAIGGGIFVGRPAIQRNVLQKYPIDLYVPGNPPHPLTFINGVLDLIRS